MVCPGGSCAARRSLFLPAGKSRAQAGAKRERARRRGMAPNNLQHRSAAEGSDGLFVRAQHDHRARGSFFDHCFLLRTMCWPSALWWKSLAKWFFQKEVTQRRVPEERHERVKNSNNKAYGEAANAAAAVWCWYTQKSVRGLSTAVAMLQYAFLA